MKFKSWAWGGIVSILLNASLAHGVSLKSGCDVEIMPCLNNGLCQNPRPLRCLDDTGYYCDYVANEADWYYPFECGYLDPGTFQSGWSCPNPTAAACCSSTFGNCSPTAGNPPCNSGSLYCCSNNNGYVYCGNGMQFYYNPCNAPLMWIDGQCQCPIAGQVPYNGECLDVCVMNPFLIGCPNQCPVCSTNPQLTPPCVAFSGGNSFTSGGTTYTECKCDTSVCPPPTEPSQFCPAIPSTAG